MAEEKVFVLMPIGNNKKKLLRVNEGSLSHNKAINNSGGWSIPTEQELVKYGESEAAQKKKVADVPSVEDKEEVVFPEVETEETEEPAADALSVEAPKEESKPKSEKKTDKKEAK